MSKRVAISQSNYIPWKGYFDLINMVDEFVLYDDVQYTRRDWRNRNRIKTRQGTQWLTVPVQVKGRYLQKINETRISDPTWARIHWRSLECAYGRAQYFPRYESTFRRLYYDPPREQLSLVNRAWIETLCGILDIRTKISSSSDYHLAEDRNHRLISICNQVGATDYYSGPAAKCYLDETAFAVAGITVHWLEYSGYPEYPQMYPPFDHYVSVLDLLFHVGPDAPHYMKSFACLCPS